MPRMKATGSAQFHTVCRPCGYEVAALVQRLMDPTQAHVTTA